MQVKKRFNMNNESGVTLIELLAAITILSIIVTAFLSFFIQGARTNTRASQVNEATFIAQEEMELMVHYSQTLSIDEIINLEEFSGSTTGLTKSSITSGYSVNTELSHYGELTNVDNLYKVKIEVKKNDALYTFLENRLAFE